VLSATLWLAHPGIAAACSVCMSGREDENQLAFILTTVFLTFLPLGLIGGVILWVRNRVREAEERERLRRERAQAPARAVWSTGAAQGS
jgi:hypothetical protein